LLVSIATAVGALVMLNVEFDAPESNIKTFGDALWWAVSTVTTVGYGDRYPTTTEGRVVAFILMLLGLGLFSVVTARIATFLIVEDSTDDESVHARLGRIEQLLEEHSRMNTRGSETALTSTGTAGLEVVDALPGEAAEADTATLVASAGSSFRGNDVRDEYET
jgi:voltage-gated potassium channel